MNKQEFKIYVASSWKNKYHNDVINLLKEEGYKPYNYRVDANFHWSDVDEHYESWTLEKFIQILAHNSKTIRGFEKDSNAYNNCDIGILVLPSGNSSHMEAGIIKARNKPLLIYIDKSEVIEKDLLYKEADRITNDLNQLRRYVDELYYYKKNNVIKFDNIFGSLSGGQTIQ